MAEFDIYLASSSPRRRELLEQLGIRYRLLDIEVDESVPPGESAEHYVQRLALDKARAGAARLQQDDPHPVLGADTSVVVEGLILGKPRDRDEALAMLHRLSGREHQVMSAVALVGSRESVMLDISTVSFRRLRPEECLAYWQTGECRDKAGAYAIQGHAAAFIQRLHGSYSGVMGLPLFQTAELLQQFGIDIFRRQETDKSHE